MDIVKRAVRIFSIAAVLIIMSAVSVLAAIDGKDIAKPLRIQNEGFEEPVVPGDRNYD